MPSQPGNALDKVLAFIYFIGFELAVYFALSRLLFNQVETNPNKDPEIVSNWNGFIYFVLLYVGITVTTMLLLTSLLPRPYKPQIMRYFWWSWLGLVVMILVVFN